MPKQSQLPPDTSINSSDNLTGYQASGPSAKRFAISDLITYFFNNGTPNTKNFYNPYKFSVYLSGTQSSSAGGTVIVKFDIKEFDTGSNVDIITNKGRFTAPVAGFYQFNAAVAFTASQTTRTITSLLKNSNEFKRGLDTNWAPGYSGGNVNSLVQLNAGDYIEVLFYSGSVSAAINNTATWFNGFLVSAT